MTAMIQRWGNSLGLRILKSIAKELRLRPGSKVEMTIKDGRLVISPATRRRYTLEDLVAGIRPGTRHGEVPWGKPRGGEVW